MNDKYKKICVMGLGYIGLPTASLLGTKGYKVHGVDISKNVVDTINQGEIHIVEPDLDILVKSAVQSGNLTASLEPCEADVFIIAVPTPFKKTPDKEHISGKQPDLSYIEDATMKIAPYINPGNLIILESTSPIGTTDEIVTKILNESGHNTEREIFVAHCPERVLPGRILIELVENARVVGGINSESTRRAVEFYSTFVKGNVLETTAKTAEMVKLTENSSRDVQIAFANELSMICEAENINTWDVISLANRHPRVNILQPGPGVGGHCIAVDPWFIVDRSPSLSNLIRTAREVNDSKPQWVLDSVLKAAGKFKQPKIGCLGLTFKADVDDMRESPSLNIVKSLKKMNIGELFICEPNISRYEGFELMSLDSVLRESDIILLLVEHKQFKTIKASDLNDKVVIDTRGVIE